MPTLTTSPSRRITDLTHRYGKARALDAVTAEIPSGCMVGLIGPDGVGKSTLMGIIAGAKKIQSGKVHVLGRRHRRTAGTATPSARSSPTCRKGSARTCISS